LFILINNIFIIGARKSLESPIVQTLKNNIEQDFKTDEPNKLAFDHLFSGIIFQKKKCNAKYNVCVYNKDNFQYKKVTGTQKPKQNFEYHSGLRPSLFSNMPPYIRFSSHDIKGINFYLKLRL